MRSGVYQLYASDCDDSLATMIKKDIKIFHDYRYSYHVFNDFQSSALLFFSHKMYYAINLSKVDVCKVNVVPSVCVFVTKVIHASSSFSTFTLRTEKWPGILQKH